jgi:tetratricopeptide (TPR) repeat protein
MTNLLKYFACCFGLVFCTVNGAASQEVKALRPDGLDGISVAQTRTPDPLLYFDLRKKAARLAADGHFSDAEPLVDRLVTDYPIDGQNWLFAGRVKRRLGKFDNASRAYRKAIELLGPVPTNNSIRSEKLVGSRNGAMPVGPVYRVLSVSSESASLTEP